MSSLVGLLSVGRIKTASVGTAPVCFVLSIWPLIQPRCWENSSSLIITMSSPFLKLRNVGSSIEEYNENQPVSKSIRWDQCERRQYCACPVLFWPCLSTSLRATAYRDRSASPPRNMVTSSAMSPAAEPLRVKSPFSVSRHTTWPEALPSLCGHHSRVRKHRMKACPVS